MRKISATNITKAVKEMCMEANYVLNDDIYSALKTSKELETSERAAEMLNIALINADIAKSNQMPICQDTGITIVFVEMGQEVYVTGGFIEDAINEGVRSGYKEGFLRKSVVDDPILRKNTNDNTPAVIYYEMKKGEDFKISVLPKGIGSENMSRLFMLSPSEGVETAKRLIIESIIHAGPNACPPLVVGVGLGGSFEKCALLAKKALLRPIGVSSAQPHIRQIEEELLTSINNLHIGPQGLGGKTTALAVHIETYATHIAGFPVAVNMSCHVTRHASRFL